MINHNETSNLQSSTIWMPTSVESAVEQMSQLRNEARYTTGGTLLQIQWENGHRIPNHLISLERIPSLKEVELNEKEHFLAIGASTALARCRNHPIIKMAHPIIGEAVQSIAADRYAKPMNDGNSRPIFQGLHHHQHYAVHSQGATYPQPNS